MSFDEYLVSKKIDSALMKSAELVLCQEWKALFEQMNPTSFTSQKLYLINPLRRKYILKEQTIFEKNGEEAATTCAPVIKSLKTLFKPKIN